MSLDDEIRALERRVRSGHPEPGDIVRLVTIRNRDRDPVAILRRRLAKLNARCRVSNMTAATYANGQRFTMTAHTIPWLHVRRLVRAALGGRMTYRWFVGPSNPFPFGHYNETPILLVAKLEDVFVVGLGITSADHHRLSDAWPKIKANGNPGQSDSLHAWALEFLDAEDRVALTLPEAQELAGDEPASWRPVRRRRRKSRRRSTSS